MPKTTDCNIALIALIAFAAWFFIALPLIYLPSQEHVYGEIIGVKYGEWLLFAATMRLWWATWRLVRSAETTAERQLRAYVFADTVSIWDGTTLDKPRPDRENFPGIVLTWKNTGQTPAGNVISWAQIAVIDPANENTLVVPPLQKLFANHLGAGVTNNKSLWFDRALTPSEIADIRVGAKGIYVYGRIEYVDIFKRSRFSNFRTVYTGVYPPFAGAIFNVCQSGNSYE
jgi:hypothetical protein